MQHIRLELARTQAHPEGSRHVGYEFTVPLAKNHELMP